MFTVHVNKMKSNDLKSRQKLTDPGEDNLFVHQYTEAALCVWQRLRHTTTYINMECVDKLYSPPFRLSDGGNNTFDFFNELQRIDQVVRLENDYPCLINHESIRPCFIFINRHC